MIKSDLVRRNSMTYINMNKTLSMLTPWPSWSIFSPIHSVGALRSCNEISGVGDPATLNVTLNAGSHCAGAVYKIQTCLWIVLHFSVRLTVQIIHPPSPYLSWTSHLPFRTVDRVQQVSKWACSLNLAVSRGSSVRVGFNTHGVWSWTWRLATLCLPWPWVWSKVHIHKWAMFPFLGSCSESSHLILTHHRHTTLLHLSTKVTHYVHIWYPMVARLKRPRTLHWAAVLNHRWAFNPMNWKFHWFLPCPRPGQTFWQIQRSMSLNDLAFSSLG